MANMRRILWTTIGLTVLGLALDLPVSLVHAQGSTFNTPGQNAGQGPQANVESLYRSPLFGPTGPTVPVAQVRIIGNTTVSEQRIRAMLNTREGRPFDDEIIQGDVRALAASRLFRDVRTFRQDSSEGVVVTFEVFERNIIRYIRYVGNDNLRSSVLSQQTGIKEGDALDTYLVEEARRKLEVFYRDHGFSAAHVALREGTEPEDQGVVFYINEGGRQRIWSTRFVGNTIASDARLRTQIQSKPGYFLLIKGEVRLDQIDEDVNRLIAYYRGLGYFRARVGRELQWDGSGSWLTLTFVIDEGPRYVVRNISFAGNMRIDTQELRQQIELHEGEAFNLSKMNSDIRMISDIYGGQGYIFADIQANPRFLEEPGFLDLVYDIDEGDQYRVGRIRVHIQGDYTTTRRNVVMNRISLSPGDIIDIRKIRSSEIRLKASQLFLNEPSRGIVPRIVVQPPELRDGGVLAEQPRPSTVRGQQPAFDRDSPYRSTPSSTGVRVVDLHVYVSENTEPPPTEGFSR